jgi:hypothetical protein
MRACKVESLYFVAVRLRQNTKSIVTRSPSDGFAATFLPEEGYFVQPSIHKSVELTLTGYSPLTLSPLPLYHSITEKLTGK